MTRKLSTYVTVRDGNGRSVTFGPNDDHVPGWASAQITHAIAWADETTPTSSTSSPAGSTDADTDDAPERPKRGRPRKAVQHADD